MPQSFRRRVLAGASAVLLCAPPALAASASAPPPPAERDRVWPQSYSDLPADPAVRFGVLANGLRYALMRNDTPKGQVSLRLRIGSGSLEETDDEQGLAHVLEHMAFKGSVHAPGTDNEMVKVLERLGLSFGGDTNARTGEEDTVYQLDLPNGDPRTLDTGLTLLSDVGSGLLLKPEALQSERGVVLSEERQGDTPNYEIYKARHQLELRGQLAADRLPIGKVQVIQTAPASLLHRFYQANYRPERATLIAVGDIDPAALQARIEQLFGGWRDEGSAAPEPDLGHPVERGFTPQLLVRAGATPSLAVAWVTPHDDTPDSFAKERRDFAENIALAALNRRFDRRAHAPDAPFLAAGVARGDLALSARLTQMQVLFRPDGWRAGLDAAVEIQRQALAFGLTQAEVDRELTEAGVRLRNAADSASTRRTPTLAEELVRSVEDEEVDTSPAEDLKLYDRFSTSLTLADVDAALRAAFQGQGPLVSLALPSAPAGGEAALADAFRHAVAAPVAPPAAHAALRWTHTDFGPAGQVAERRAVPDLGVSFVRFVNGVKLIVRPSTLRKDQILVGVSFGHGRLDLPRDRVAPDWASSAFLGGGLDDLSFEDIQQVLADRTASVGFGVGDDSYSLSGVTRPKDLQLQMQLLAAYMTRPGWRPEAFARTQALAGVRLAQLSSTPQGVEGRDLPRLQHGGDARWAVPTPAEARAARLDELKALIAPALGSGPLEVVVTGDTTVEAAVAAVASTFAALPPRPPEARAPAGATEVRFPAPTAQPVTRTHTGRADQAVAYIAWPAADLLSDPQRARRINMASEVLQLRLVDQLRTAEGATYSPAAGASESDTFPGYGYVYAGVETPPGKIAGFYAAADRIAADLAARGPTPDELQRAVRPRMEGIERAQQTNSYWGAMLHDSFDDPRRLELIRSSLPGYRRITAADVQAAARAYLAPSRAWRFQVTPAAPTP
jgi:zinc protease